LWIPALVLVAASALGLFYYLRVIAMIFQGPVSRGVDFGLWTLDFRLVPLAAAVVLAVLVLALVWLGVYPSPVIDIIHSAVGGLLSSVSP
jgi:NADH-quinone oxidoreductase subunit N